MFCYLLPHLSSLIKVDKPDQAHNAATAPPAKHTIAGGQAHSRVSDLLTTELVVHATSFCVTPAAADTTVMMLGCETCSASSLVMHVNTMQ